MILTSHYNLPLFALLLVAWVSPSLATPPLNILDPGNEGLSAFEEESFVGHTDYQIVEHDGTTTLRAAANNSASALYRKIAVDLNRTPLLTWEWKVERLLPANNPQEKAGDDFPARVYVVVQDGFLPWQVKVLSYVWANSEPPAPYWPNPFTERAVMIPLQAGTEHLGQWRREQVNIAEDYQRIFGEPIKEIVGVAIMSDADNGGGQTLAYFGRIRFEVPSARQK